LSFCVDGNLWYHHFWCTLPFPKEGIETTKRLSGGNRMESTVPDRRKEKSNTIRYTKVSTIWCLLSPRPVTTISPLFTLKTLSPLPSRHRDLSKEDQTKETKENDSQQRVTDLSLDHNHMKTFSFATCLVDKKKLYRFSIT
jgi:hypothetical protein